ncbi:MAG TPA: AAA domain-containing protein [Candidatus Angelobacter sp.]|nr:AAA domain-containing protein [Candidatus Angelobacter sp.]
MSTIPIGPPAVPPISPQRSLLVDQARQSWIRKLIDLSRRNNLLYFRSLKTGTLDLVNADQENMAAFLRGEDVSVKKLLPTAIGEATTNTVREIARRAMANLEEKGLQTLFVTMGQATWPATDGGRPAEAPILLIPALFETRGSNNFYLKRNGTVQANLVLLHVFETQFGVKLNPDDLLAKLSGDEEGEPFDVSSVYTVIRDKCSAVPGLDIKDFTVLGNFAFQKMAMVKDLQERSQELSAHDIISAIAGDSDARSAVSSAQHELEPRQLDQVSPDNEFNVLDADSSQQCAIADILAGQSAVIHGPPGTGKSQTIANLIASLAATGKRVLFVAEKRAALDVVLRRLSNVGLEHLSIDLHGADLSPRKVMQQVARTLDMVRNSTPVQPEEIHTQLVDRRSRLNRHVSRLHDRREPTGKSIYEMQGHLVRLLVKSATRWREAELKRIDMKTAQQIRDLLVEARGFTSLFLGIDPSPWCGANLPEGKAVQQALDLVSHLNSENWSVFLDSLNAVLRKTKIGCPRSVKNVRELVALLCAVQHTLTIYSPDLYKQDLHKFLTDLNPGKEGRLGTAWALLTNSKFRHARSAVLRLRTQGKASTAVLFGELVKAAAELKTWTGLAQSNTAPISIADFERQLGIFSGMFESLARLSLIIPWGPLEELSLEHLGDTIRKLAADSSTAWQIPRLTEIEKNLEMCGAGKLVTELRETKPDSTLWLEIFEYTWLSSTLDALSQQDSEIRGFKGVTHNGYVEDFTRLDEERLALAAERVRRSHGLNAIASMNAHPEQQHLIKAEASKARKHLPLRKVFAQAAEVLTAVCPCWMASPLSVSQLLDGGKQYFDFVIFDEASQILPEDAVSAMLRGKSIVVAGDNKQLPPTTFFAAGDDDEYVAEEEASSVEGFESLLDMMIPFVRSRYLDWHYRSRDEALINFSNHHLYQDRLVTFPGPGGPAVIDHVFVKQELGIDGQEESSNVEVRKVIELILAHARKRPEETLGVITMGIRHMNRVQAALDRELEKHADLHEFFDPNSSERFFVKNLERVQGDERDAIIISIGYGKDRAGNLPLRFGPLLSAGGRRRLNVAITRSRERLTLVSSFNHMDIDVSRVRPGSGVELLSDYLQYAASSGKRLGDAQLTTVPLNDFEADIFDVLSGQGLKLVPQVGASRFRIDMVAQHPQKPGRFVLAIECDGATYHSSYTARDRDRLRQQQLENLGWRFHRIWSTDWFLRKEDEVKRTLTAFEEAVKFADKIDSDPSSLNGDSNDRARLQADSHPARTEAQAQHRQPRPQIPVKPSIAQYSMRELAELIKWVSSDGKLRTDEEIISEMVSTLGFTRRGVRIESAIRSAISIARPR